jgi:hypothetical protein
MHSFTQIGDISREAHRNIDLMKILEATCLRGTTPAQHKLRRHCYFASTTANELVQVAARADELILRRIQELAQDWNAEFEEHIAEVISWRELACAFLPTAKCPQARRTHEQVLQAVEQSMITAAAIVHWCTLVQTHASHACSLIQDLMQWASDMDELRIIKEATSIILCNME